MFGHLDRSLLEERCRKLMLEKASLEEALEAIGVCIYLGSRLDKQDNVCKRLSQMLAERVEAREKSSGGFPAPALLRAEVKKLEAELLDSMNR